MFFTITVQTEEEHFRNGGKPLVGHDAKQPAQDGKWILFVLVFAVGNNILERYLKPTLLTALLKTHSYAHHGYLPAFIWSISCAHLQKLMLALPLLSA